MGTEKVDQIAFLLCGKLDFCCHDGEKRIGQIGQNHCDDVASPVPERDGRLIGNIAHFFRGFPDSFRGLRADIRHTPEGTGYGRCRQSCGTCKVAECYMAFTVFQIHLTFPLLSLGTNMDYIHILP